MGSQLSCISQHLQPLTTFLTTKLMIPFGAKWSLWSQASKTTGTSGRMDKLVSLNGAIVCTSPIAPHVRMWDYDSVGGATTVRFDAFILVDGPPIGFLSDSFRS